MKQILTSHLSPLTSLLCLLLTGCTLGELTPDDSLSYHFDRPAAIWEESFPLGNGRLGMMPDGGVDRENIVLNELSLWSGSRQDADNPYAYGYLARIRQLLFQGRNDEAQELMYQTFVCKGEGSGHGNGANVPYGSYQILGNLRIDYTYLRGSENLTAYRRELNLEQAVSTVFYGKGEVGYTREAFASFADDAGVIRLSADTDKALNFSIGLNRPERFHTTTDRNDLVMEGQLNDGAGTDTGMRYAARVRILLSKGGSLSATDTSVSVINATEAVLLVALATSYDGKDPAAEALSRLNALTKKDYATMKREHIQAYAGRFDRVKLTLGKTAKDKLPIDRRLAAFHADKDDPALAALYFQFGRYLLISSTRPGGLPPNLQGLWCNTIQTPWNGDYHLNINLQMNLWPAEVTNLSELHLPLVEWTRQQVGSGEQTAKTFYNARGWVTHILGNVWQFTSPGEHPSWGATNTSAAWLCAHLYQHYLYTLDKEYLRSVYPVMKGAALFFTDVLTEDPRNGYLVTAPTTSPENAFILPNGNRANICAGSTMDNQILRELFGNTIAAADSLGIDRDFRDELAAKRSRLMPTSIGPDGRIMEWLEDFKEAEPAHRHVSHLYGLYPGNEISVENTPALAEAARRTLDARGDKSTGWSMAWKMAFWARLYDGDHALRLFNELLTPVATSETNMRDGGGTYPNLFCAHPPFQIDGNFGACAAIAEMLVQCQTGTVVFLPALPSAWKSGSYKGLRIQGGAEVSARWDANRLMEASLKASVARHFRIKLPEASGNLSLRVNQKAISLPVISGILAIDLQAGDELVMSF